MPPPLQMQEKLFECTAPGQLEKWGPLNIPHHVGLPETLLGLMKPFQLLVRLSKSHYHTTVIGPVEKHMYKSDNSLIIILVQFNVSLSYNFTKVTTLWALLWYN